MLIDKQVNMFFVNVECRKKLFLFAKISLSDIYGYTVSKEG